MDLGWAIIHFLEIVSSDRSSYSDDVLVYIQLGERKPKCYCFFFKEIVVENTYVMHGIFIFLQ